MVWSVELYVVRFIREECSRLGRDTDTIKPYVLLSHHFNRDNNVDGFKFLHVSSLLSGLPLRKGFSPWFTRFPRYVNHVFISTMFTNDRKLDIE